MNYEFLSCGEENITIKCSTHVHIYLVLKKLLVFQVICENDKNTAEVHGLIIKLIIRILQHLCYTMPLSIKMVAVSECIKSRL